MSQESSPEMANPHQARLMASNYKLLETGKYSDLVIRCGAKEWNVHRAIVCEGSKFFATACDGPFMVSGFRYSRRASMGTCSPGMLFTGFMAITFYIFPLRVSFWPPSRHRQSDRTFAVLRPSGFRAICPFLQLYMRSPILIA